MRQGPLPGTIRRQGLDFSALALVIPPKSVRVVPVWKRRETSLQEEDDMGLLGKLFSSKPDFPAIDPASAAAARVAKFEQELHDLAETVKQPLEVIPAQSAAYVFIGKPPKKFGLAWIDGDKVKGLNTLVEEHGMKPAEVARVVDQLRDVYERHSDADRFTATVKDVDIVVTPSSRFEDEVHKVIDTILQH
jgi:hypothetical protein